MTLLGKCNFSSKHLARTNCRTNILERFDDPSKILRHSRWSPDLSLIKKKLSFLFTSVVVASGYAVRALHGCHLNLGSHPFPRLDLLLVPRCFRGLGLASPCLIFLSQSLLASKSKLYWVIMQYMDTIKWVYEFCLLVLFFLCLFILLVFVCLSFVSVSVYVCVLVFVFC